MMNKKILSLLGGILGLNLVSAAGMTGAAVGVSSPGLWIGIVGIVVVGFIIYFLIRGNKNEN